MKEPRCNLLSVFSNCILKVLILIQSNQCFCRRYSFLHNPVPMKQKCPTMNFGWKPNFMFPVSPSCFSVNLYPNINSQKYVPQTRNASIRGQVLGILFETLAHSVDKFRQTRICQNLNAYFHQNSKINKKMERKSSFAYCISLKWFFILNGSVRVNY